LFKEKNKSFSSTTLFEFLTEQIRGGIGAIRGHAVPAVRSAPPATAVLSYASQHPVATTLRGATA
jgi:hypothetical protein